MTSKERIITVVKKGEAADKVPWSLNFGAYQTMRRSFLNRYKESRGIKENLFDLFDYDIIPIQAPEALDSNGESGTIKFLSNNIDPEKYYTKEQLSRPGAFVDGWGHLNIPWPNDPDCANVESPLANIESIEEIYEYPFPELDPASIEAARKDVEAIHAKNKFASSDCGGLFGASWYLRGMENYLMDMLAEPEWAEAIADKVTESLIKRVEVNASIGVDVFCYADDLGTQTAAQISPKLWRELIKPRWAKVFEAIRKANPNAFIFMHSCGYVKDFIPDFIDLGVDMLHPIQPEAMDVYEVAKEYQKYITFWGTTSMQKTVTLGTPQDIHNEIRERVEHIGQNGHLIISPGNMFSPETPFENVDAFIEACQKYC